MNVFCVLEDFIRTQFAKRHASDVLTLHTLDMKAAKVKMTVYVSHFSIFKKTEGLFYFMGYYEIFEIYKTLMQTLQKNNSFYKQY